MLKYVNMKISYLYNNKMSREKKTRNFLIHKTSNQDLYILQSEDTIGVVNINTGKGKYSKQGGYFPHLSMGIPCLFSSDTLDTLKSFINQENNNLPLVELF